MAPIIKKHEIKQMDVKAMDDKIKELKDELLKVGAQTAVGSGSENPKRTRQIKRAIAKLLTFKNQKPKEEKQKA